MIKDMLLASSSPYRKALLERLNWPFITFSPEVDETPHPGESPPELVKRLSIKKAQYAGLKYPQHLCIGSDEVACLNQRILGKPLTHANAVMQLHAQSGQVLYFYTGVCVYHPLTQYIDYHLATTEVKFKQLNSAQIEHYLQKLQPYQCAASFQSETLGSALIEYCRSDDPSAIIGLPMIRLCQMLIAQGIPLLG